MKRLSFVKGAFVAACLVTGTSIASVPVLSDVTPVLLQPRGASSDMSGWVEVLNPNRVELRAVARSVSSPLGYFVEARAEPILVKPGETVKLPFRMAIRTDGLYHVTIPVDLVGAEGANVGRVVGTLDVQVRDGIYAVDSYENLFVRPVSRESDEDGNAVYVFQAAPPPTGFPDSEDYQAPRWTVAQLEVITDAMVKEIIPGTGEEVESPTLPLPPPRDTSVRHVDPEAAKFTQRSVDARIARAMEASSSAPAPMMLDDGIATGMKAMGSFNYTGVDGLLHPAWGWQVYAQMVIGSSKVAIAKTSVQPNGNWVMTLPSVPSAFPIVISYEPRNLYFTLRNPGGAYYSFSSGGKHTPADNKVLNEYKQAAYLATSDLVGLGEVHRDGMSFWETLKSRGEGIDPVKSSSITIYYPNTDEDCGQPNGKPWSCASGDEIWIIPAHAQQNVLMHELGHQLMFKFWNGGSPSGSGKAHGWTDCVNKGVALSEGFADFMLVWANLDRTQDPATNGFVDIEHPENIGISGACTTTNENEAWVAGNFWDFYDSHVDGKDTLFYVHTGATPKLFLNHGTRDSMAEYLGLFQAIVSPQHLPLVKSIFNQNHQ